METKKQIQRELNDFLVTVATNYGDLISKKIPPMRFKQVVEAVGVARDKTQDNLVAITREAVIAAVIENDQAQFIPSIENPLDMVSKLVPADALIPYGAAQEFYPTATMTEGEDPSYRQYVEPGLAAPSSTLEGPLTSPPRFTTGDPSAPMPSLPPPGGGLFDDDGDGEDYHTPPTETMAEISRRNAGLPVKLKRPTIHVDHMGKHEQPLQPTAQRLAPPQATAPVPITRVADVNVVMPQDALIACFQGLENLLVPHLQTKDTALFGVVCAALEYVARGKGLVTHLKVIPDAPGKDLLEEE
jgi:hypothetical protein